MIKIINFVKFVILWQNSLFFPFTINNQELAWNLTTYLAEEVKDNGNHGDTSAADAQFHSHMIALVSDLLVGFYLLTLSINARLKVVIAAGVLCFCNLQLKYKYSSACSSLNVMFPAHVERRGCRWTGVIAGTGTVTDTGTFFMCCWRFSLHPELLSGLLLWPQLPCKHISGINIWLWPLLLGY